MTTAIASDHARVTYDAFAEHYDLFTAHHDYDSWTATLERLALDCGLRGMQLLDVACGTGKSLLPFAARGYSVTGCDVSPSMLQRASQKVGPDVRLEVRDMRALPRLGSFDLICCLDDAANYLMSTGELVAMLDGLRRNLAQDGVIVFDVNSVRSYQTFYGSLTVMPSDDAVVVWDGHAPATFGPGDAAHATAQMLERLPDGGWRRRSADHHQRHHPRSVVEGAIERAGLTCAAVRGMQLDGTLTDAFAEDRNSKAVYVARHRSGQGAPP
jgi:SAM-dependent methyltransferase